MYIENKNSTVQRVLNAQFKLAGYDITFEDIPNTEIVEVGKKKLYYWEVYKFKDQEEYEKWRRWALEEFKKYNVEDNFDWIDLTWGLSFHIKKELLLF